MTVIVARADDSFSRLLRGSGVEVINLELIRTSVLDDLSEFENLITGLEEYDGVFFTSPVAAAVFVAHVSPPTESKLYALGRRAVSVLENADFETEDPAGANTAEQLLARFGDEGFVGKKLLFVRGERSIRSIPEKLAGKAQVDEVVVYRTVELDPAEEVLDMIRGRLVKSEVEWICFFSPSAVEAFEKRFGVLGVSVAAIGETTANRATELGFKPELVSSMASNEVFAQELIERIQGKEIV